MQVKGAFFLCYSYRITVILEHQKYSHLLYSADKPQTPHLSNPYVFQRGRYGNKHRVWEVDFALFFLVVHKNLLIHFSSTFYFSVFNYRKEVHTSCICEPLCTHSFIIKKKQGQTAQLSPSSSSFVMDIFLLFSPLLEPLSNMTAMFLPRAAC